MTEPATRAGELQLLRQIDRSERLASTHSETIAILVRLHAKGEVMMWRWPDSPGYIFEITATGKAALRRLRGEATPAKKAIDALKALPQAYDGGDYEASHPKADQVLCDLLTELGYGEVAAAFEKVGRWYS